MQIEFKFNIDDRVITPFKAKGIVSMLGVDDGGKVYFVKTEKESDWFKEKDLKSDE